MSKIALRAVLRRFSGVLGIEPLTNYQLIKKRHHSSTRRQKRGNPVYGQKQGQGWHKNTQKTGQKTPYNMQERPYTNINNAHRYQVSCHKITFQKTAIIEHFP
jgi:hypothetical protein